MRTRYDTVSASLHWLIAGGIIFMLWYGHYVSDLPKGSFARLEGFQLHYSIGLTILVLSLVRLIWRVLHPAPKLPATMKAWEKALAKAVHIMFYALMIMIPLAGWAAATTSPLDVPIYFFDLFQWPWFPGIKNAESREIIHEVFGEMHETMGRAMLGLLALHVLAVLKHTFIDRDRLFKRMWFGK